MTGSGESGGEIGESGYGGGGREMKQMGSVRGRCVLVVVVLGHAMAAVEGRQRAFLSKHQEYTVKEVINVPPVSIMNAVEFETVDAPGITMVADRGTSRSMRWTCMYNVTLFQGDHMSVKDFPHDEH